MAKIYREYINHRCEYWMYVDGQRHFVNAQWAMHEVKRGLARIVEVY